MAKNKSVVLNDLHDLQDIDQIKKQARASARDLRNFAGQINNLAHEFVGIANDEVKGARREVTRRIEADPVKAAATAFVAGFLLRAIVWR